MQIFPHFTSRASSLPRFLFYCFSVFLQIFFVDVFFSCHTGSLRCQWSTQCCVYVFPDTLQIHCSCFQTSFQKCITLSSRCPSPPSLSPPPSVPRSRGSQLHLPAAHMYPITATIISRVTSPSSPPLFFLSLSLSLSQFLTCCSPSRPLRPS